VGEGTGKKGRKGTYPELLHVKGKTLSYGMNKLGAKLKKSI
jgi:hypothetical protein